MNTTGDYALAWGGTFSAETLKNAMIVDLDAGYPILANGISGGSESYVTLSWYPSGTYHFVCVFGYSDYGNTTWVCDPVANALVVQAWVLIQSFRIMDTRNLPFICLSYLEA